MNSYPEWLPPLVPFSDYCNWELYVNALYEFYLDDFVRSGFIVNDRQVRFRREPQYKGKDKNFWHILGDDKSGPEAELRRYERIRWPKPIVINRYDDKVSIKIWSESDHRGAVGKLRHHIWFSDEYLVVIEEREKYYLFITAYPTNWEHSRQKLEQRYINNKSGRRI
jgi:hypothetical protein